MIVGCTICSVQQCRGPLLAGTLARMRWQQRPWTPSWHSCPTYPTGPTTGQRWASGTSPTMPRSLPMAAGSACCSTTAQVHLLLLPSCTPLPARLNAFSITWHRVRRAFVLSPLGFPVGCSCVEMGALCDKTFHALHIRGQSCLQSDDNADSR